MNFGEKIPDANKMYIREPDMDPVTLMPAYQPETYYRLVGDTYKLATQATKDTNTTYYSLKDTWTSGDIYVPGCYYIKNGSS